MPDRAEFRMVNGSIHFMPLDKQVTVDDLLKECVGSNYLVIENEGGPKTVCLHTRHIVSIEVRRRD